MIGHHCVCVCVTVCVINRSLNRLWKNRSSGRELIWLYTSVSIPEMDKLFHKILSPSVILDKYNGCDNFSHTILVSCSQLKCDLFGPYQIDTYLFLQMYT